MSTAGLSDIVRYGRLQHRVDGRTVPYNPTCFDDELLTAVDAAQQRWVPLAVVLPLPGTATPVLLGAAALIGAAVRRRHLDVNVAVVSKHLTHRHLYDELCLDQQRLRELIPRARLDATGHSITIGRSATAGSGRLLLTGDPTRLDPARTPMDAYVLDSSACTPETLRSLLSLPATGTPVVYLTSNPLDPALSDVRGAGGAVWSWDIGDLAPLSAAARTDLPASAAGTLAASAELLTVSGAAHRQIWLPDRDTGPDRALDDASAGLWRALARLSAGHRQPPGSAHQLSSALRWVWAVHNTLTLLPIAPQRYDASLPDSPYATKLATAAETARTFARHAPPDAASAWFTVADALTDLLQAAAAEPKLARIADWVQQVAADPERTGVLVTRNRHAARMLTHALDELASTPVGWDARVSVSSVSDLLAGRSSATSDLLLCGPVPRSAAGLLAMPPTSSITVLAAGSWEGTRIRQQLLAATAALRSLRTETITMSAPLLRVAPRRTDMFGDEPDLSAVRAGAAAPLPAHPERPLWEPFDADVVAILNRLGAGSRDHLPPAPVRNGDASTTVPVITVELDTTDSSQVVLLAPNDLVHRRRGAHLGRVAAKSLTPGDLLILVDHGARHDLFETVTARLAELPAYMPLAALISYWRARAAAARHLDMTYDKILNAMVSDGSQLTSSGTVGTWIRGDVDGPLDRADVGRFARAISDPDLQRRADAIGAALHTLHAVHRKVGRWLTRQIGSAADRDDPDDLVDAELGLHVVDLLESVTLNTVTHVDLTVVHAPAGAVGVILDSPAAAAVTTADPAAISTG